METQRQFMLVRVLNQSIHIMHHMDAVETHISLQIMEVFCQWMGCQYHIQGTFQRLSLHSSSSTNLHSRKLYHQGKCDFFAYLQFQASFDPFL